MGKLIGWECDDCGAREAFHCGGGMMGFSDPEVIEHSCDGSFGPAMKTLLGNGVPDGWSTYNEAVYYQCPNCDHIIPGGAVRIEDGSGSWLVYHIEPDDCEVCGEELAFWDDKVPLSEDELLKRCFQRSEEPCPKCGGKNVQLTLGDWD